MRSVYLALSLCLVASCGGDPNNVEKDKHELLRDAYELNLEKWHALGLVDYQFDLSFNYYCDESGKYANTYIVEAGQPIRVNGYTVEDVFILAAEKIELPSYQLEVEYDEVYGVPLKVKFNDSYSIADDELCMVVSSFQPIAPTNL